MGGGRGSRRGWASQTCSPTVPEIPFCGLIAGGCHATMRYVFISHASDDKPRLRAYIHRLLDELPEDIGLWIDTPEKIDHELSAPRVVAIEPGGDWEARIGHAINNCTCVLAFWSTAAVTGV